MNKPSFALTIQRGSVLIVSMLILLVLTLLGVTALSMVSVEERMARGFEHGEVVFQGSESAISQVITAGTPQVLSNDSYVARPGYTVANDPLDLAIDNSTCSGTTLSNNIVIPATIDVDPNDKLPNTTVQATMEVRYLGERAAPGFSMGVGSSTMAAQTFQVRAATQIGSTEITSTHDQGLYIIAPSGGSCIFTGPP